MSKTLSLSEAMMKLIGSNTWRGGYAISRVFYSAKAQSSSSIPKKTLYKRITGFGDPKTSIIPVLDQWVEEGRHFHHSELQKLIRQLRRYRRYSHALEIQEWMNDKMKLELTSGGRAIRLDLISKVHGISKAEEYFSSIPIDSRTHQVYGALLHCYAENSCFEKAEEIFRELKELGFVQGVLTYNVMLSLYSRVGEEEKFSNLLKEMEENCVEGDSYTFCIQLNFYANSDVEKMEKILVEMKADSKVEMDFHAYVAAARGFLTAGLSEKALPMIRKSEELIKVKGNRIFLEHLLSLYAAAGEKDEVYRIWELYKQGRVYNTGYNSVITSLLKLEDFDGAEKVFEECISGSTEIDGQIVNTIVSSYCKKHLVEKAFACIERVTSKGHKVDTCVWQSLANACRLGGQVARAVEPMKKAILGCGERKILNRYTLADCLEYLKKEADSDAALEIVGLLRSSGFFSEDVCSRLVDFVNSNEEREALEAILKKGNQTENDIAVEGKMN